MSVFLPMTEDRGLRDQSAGDQVASRRRCTGTRRSTRLNLRQSDNKARNAMQGESYVNNNAQETKTGMRHRKRNTPQRPDNDISL